MPFKIITDLTDRGIWTLDRIPTGLSEAKVLFHLQGDFTLHKTPKMESHQERQFCVWFHIYFKERCVNMDSYLMKLISFKTVI